MCPDATILCSQIRGGTALWSAREHPDPGLVHVQDRLAAIVLNTCVTFPESSSDSPIRLQDLEGGSKGDSGQMERRIAGNGRGTTGLHGDTAAPSRLRPRATHQRGATA